MVIKLVVFDFDGTLALTDGNYLLAKYLGKEKEFTDIVSKYRARKMDGEEAVEKLASAYKGVRLQEVQKIRKEIKLRDGAFETIQKLKEKGIKVAIVTGEANEMMRDMLEFLKPDHFDGVDPVFDENGIFTGEIKWDFRYKSELVHHLMNKYDLKSKEVMAVGDTWYDKAMLPDGGIFVSIGDEDLSDLEDYHINDITEVLDLVEKLREDE